MNINKMPYGYLECTDESFPKITTINNTMLRYLDLTRDTLVWDHFYKENIYFMIPTLEHENFRQQLNKARESQQTICIHHHFLNQNNQETNFITLIKFICNNNTTSYYSIISDPARSDDCDVAICEDTYSTPPMSASVFARTFGYFDLFCNGDPVFFSTPKAKELLAILIDRKGGTLTPSEAITILWPDQMIDNSLKNKYRKLCMSLHRTLEKYNISDILISHNGVRYVNTSAFVCDYYEFLKNNQFYKETFHNAYMTNYSWAEETLSTIIWNHL